MDNYLCFCLLFTYSGFDVFPDDPKDVTVIPFAAPNIFYHKDIPKIGKHILSRITNFWNFNDPVPIILNGLQDETKKNVDFSFLGLGKMATDDKLLQLATNAAIGNVIIFMRDKQRIKAPKKKTTDPGYIESKTEVVWTKFIPYETVVSSDQGIYYITNGATCLWKTTRLGALGGIKGAVQNHPMKKYRQSVIDSCLNKYLQSKSEYWKDKVVPKEEITKLARSIDENKYIEYDEKYMDEYVDDADLMDYNKSWMGDVMMQIVSIALVVLICACGFGAMCGFIIAMFKKVA